VVVAAGTTDSTPRGTTIDIFFIFSGGYCRTSASTPQGPTIVVFYIFGGGCCRTTDSTPLGGLPSKSSTSLVVATVGLLTLLPRGPTIDVFFIFGGGCYRTTDSTPRVLAIGVLLNLVSATSIFLATPTRGPLR
jgi:hypothetical protein